MILKNKGTFSISVKNHEFYQFCTIENFFARILKRAAARTGTKFSFCVSMVEAAEVSGDVWILNDW